MMNFLAWHKLPAANYSINVTEFDKTFLKQHWFSVSLFGIKNAVVNLTSRRYPDA